MMHQPLDWSNHQQQFLEEWIKYNSMERVQRFKWKTMTFLSKHMDQVWEIYNKKDAIGVGMVPIVFTHYQCADRAAVRFIDPEQLPETNNFAHCVVQFDMRVKKHVVNHINTSFPVLLMHKENVNGDQWLHYMKNQHKFEFSPLEERVIRSGAPTGFHCHFPAAQASFWPSRNAMEFWREYIKLSV